jgi:hypothetical protein
MGCYLIKLGRLVVGQYFSLLCICYFFYDSNLTTSAYNKTFVLSYRGWGLAYEADEWLLFDQIREAGGSSIFLSSSVHMLLLLLLETHHVSL